MHSFRAQHIPALDGLRGIAILLVITHHQLIPVSLKAGFLGVDLFFVLSGFLITTLLLREFNATNSISLKNFYARRVLRLAPALVIYLAVTLLVTHQLHPELFAQQIRLVGLSLAYLTNWRMALGWDSSLDPTAIIWSLSIEEQFYLLWPPILVLALSLRIKRTEIAIALALLIIGIAVHRSSLLTSGTDLNRMYYGTDTRADAPLVGCLIALISTWRVSSGRLKAALNLSAVGFAGLLVYLVATLTFTDRFLYRGGYTLVACASGILIWNIADSPTSILAKVLSWYPLRWFGLISYGLYLWHWLLLRSVSFYWLAGGLDAWVRCLAAISVSAFSFYFVERQFTKLKTRFSYSHPQSPKLTKSNADHDKPPTLVSPFVSQTVIQPTE
jgi:peptidoglycan/LPS O-acetylase OafA/YrhL